MFCQSSVQVVNRVRSAVFIRAKAQMKTMTADSYGVWKIQLP